MENPPHIYPFKPWTSGDELKSSSTKSGMTLLMFQEMNLGNFGCPLVQFLEAIKFSGFPRQFFDEREQNLAQIRLLLVQPEWQGKHCWATQIPSPELQTLELLAKTCLCLSCTWSCYPPGMANKKRGKNPGCFRCVLFRQFWGLQLSHVPIDFGVAKVAFVVSPSFSS